MKKIEAQSLAPEKSKLLIDYIYQILSDKNNINYDKLIVMQETKLKLVLKMKLIF